MRPNDQPLTPRTDRGDMLGMILGALGAIICLSLIAFAIAITQPAPLSIALAYTPELPAPGCQDPNGCATPPPDLPLATTGAASNWSMAVWGAVVLIVAGAAFAWSTWTERKAQR